MKRKPSLSVRQRKMRGRQKKRASRLAEAGARPRARTPPLAPDAWAKLLNDWPRLYKKLLVNEQKFVNGVAKGMPLHEIADGLNISFPKLNALSYRLYRKLGVPGKDELTFLAVYGNVSLNRRKKA